MSIAGYNSQEAAYNRTIQHTVASSMDGVAPEQVSDITVKAVATPPATAASVCSLSYTVRVFDPRLSYKKLIDQLDESASSGNMDENLRSYAARFGISDLVNGTFVHLSVSNGATDSEADSSSSDGVHTSVIIGVAIGGFLFLVLAVGSVWYCVAQKNVRASKVYVAPTKSEDV
jgi:hypothetical protein